MRLIFALFIVLLISGCGGEGNTGKPSIIRNLEYVVDKDIIVVSWSEPQQNFNFSIDEYNNKNYFILEIQGIISGSIEVKIEQIEGKSTYQYLLSNNEILNNYKDTITLSLKALNNNYFESDPVFLELKLPEVTNKPSVKNSNFVQVRQQNNIIEFCNFLNLEWSNQALYYTIKYSGALNGKESFEGWEYQKIDPCLTVLSEKAISGRINYEITAENRFGSASITGSNSISSNSGFENGSNDEGNEAPKIENPFQRDFDSKNSEIVAKLSWCINEGYRDYNYSKDECTNTRNR